MLSFKSYTVTIYVKHATSQTHPETFFMERWKEVPGFPNYEASTHGRLRNKKTGKKLEGTINPSGYIRVSLPKKSKKSMHRLIAVTWIPNDDPSNKTTVDHINRIKTDNRAINLRWASQKQQNQNKTIGRISFKRPVQQICPQSNKVLRVFESAADAGRHMGNKTRTPITLACQKKAKTAYGFKWAYIPDRDCPNERWKPIPQHPTYQFSTYGRLKNKRGVINDYVNCSRTTVYPIIGIQQKRYYRHILLGDLFIGKPSEEHVYNHKDGNKWNCHIDNLEACTRSENIIHAHENGLVSSTNFVEVVCMKTGNKRKFRSMRHASVDGFNKYHNWMCHQVKRKKRSTFEYQGHIIKVIRKTK